MKLFVYVWIEVLEEPSVGKYKLVVIPINITDDWRILIRDYL